MTATKPILYRVETYIVPKTKNLVLNIDDCKIANQFNIKSEKIFENNTQNEEDALHNKCEEFAYSTETSKLIDIKLVKDITKENETLRNGCFDNKIVKYYNDENFCQSNKHTQKTEFQASIGPQEALYPAKQFSKINSLISIDETSENSLDIKLNDFCRHGYKNGCTAMIPSPEEISEKIFRENWLQKIEILRNRETILREREMNLQKKERKLFRKEKELRITERLLNDKIKQADQQLKYQKDTLKYQRDTLVEKRLEEAARILSGDVEKSNNLLEEKILRKDIPKTEDILKKEEIPKEEISRKEIGRKEEIPRKEIGRKEEIPRKEEILKKEDIPKKYEIPKKEEIPRKAEIPKKAEISKNLRSIVNPYESKEEYNKKIIHLMRSNSSSRKSFSRTHSYATIRVPYKERPKIMNYDDFNSTLSAASVDSPNMRTSVLFDPVLYKKPYAFTKSVNEPRTKHKDTAEKLQRVVEEKSEHVIEENKIFQKVSDNICALQEKKARFQNYGLVDCIPDGVPSKAERNSGNEETLSSYLDVEISKENKNRRQRVSVCKDRPVSWTNETNEQQKKHQVFSTVTKQSAENKENVVCSTRCIAKKKAKNTKSKKFFLFR